MIYARCDRLHKDLLYVLVNMGTYEATADLEYVVMGNYLKVTIFTTRLESVKKYVIQLITEVMTEVVLARWDQGTTNTEVEKTTT